MDQILNVLALKEVTIGIAILAVLLIALFIIRRMRFSNYKKSFDDLNIEYNLIKSVPLNFKLNKAVAIARVNQETMNLITQCKDDYEKIQNNFEQMGRLLAETDDNITIHKAKLVKHNLVDLSNCIDIGKEQVSKLEKHLDTILERENEQRTRVTELKEAFRDVKSNVVKNAQSLGFSFPAIEKKLEALESLFSVFEEYMYASEFEKSNDVLKEIGDKIQLLENDRLALPTLIEKAKGVIPNLVDELKREVALSLQRGTYLEHLNVENNLETVNESLKSDLGNIEQLKLDKINDSLDSSYVRLVQLHKQVHNENEAFIEAKQFAKGCDEEFLRVSVLLAENKEIFPKVESRFGSMELKADLSVYDKKLTALTAQKDEIKRILQQACEPATTTNAKIKEIAQEISIMAKELSLSKDRLIQASQDERRAQKQLLKLQLITNEMQVKIVKNKMPSISKQFDNDVKRAGSMIEEIELILEQLPIDINKLNYQLNAAIDYIYKLYNDVNNLVGMAIMVEHTIVFGNKYRSTHPTLDSELTRSELCYRNGEYTQALEIAIAAIEKLFPNSYDKLIKENALSAK